MAKKDKTTPVIEISCRVMDGEGRMVQADVVRGKARSVLMTSTDSVEVEDVVELASHFRVAVSRALLEPCVVPGTLKISFEYQKP